MVPNDTPRKIKILHQVVPYIRSCVSVCLVLLQIGSVSFDRQGVADHATQLANNIQGNLKRSLEALGVVRHVHSSQYSTCCSRTVICISALHVAGKQEAGCAL